MLHETMKKLLILLALFISTTAYCKKDLPDSNSVLSDSYSLSFHASYAHNLTYSSYTNFDLNAFIPVNRHFEAETNLRASTANFYTFGVKLRYVFLLSGRELFVENRLLSNIVLRDHVNDFAHAISLGCKMQYVNVQLGNFSRVIIPTPYEYHSDNSYIAEPFNLLYRVEAFVRPQNSGWNIAVAVSNVDDFIMERAWVPVLYLGGWYNVNDHWRMHLTGKYKNAGTFHMNAHYYASELRMGVEYRF